MTYDYPTVHAVYQLGVRSGFSLRKRGEPTGAEGDVIDLAAWLERRAGRPCLINPDELCTGQRACTHTDPATVDTDPIEPAATEAPAVNDNSGRTQP